MSGPGRRKGNPQTREEIIDAARAAFSEHGFDRASVRDIAGRAGVDPSLVYHYFDDKAAMFAASIDLPWDPTEAIAAALEEDLAHGGEQLVRLFLSIWEMEQPRAALLGMLRSALGGNDHALEVIGSTVIASISHTLARVSPSPDVEMRAQGIASQLIGMAMVRYVAQLEPLASADVDEIVRMIGPRIQSYIDR